MDLDRTTASAGHLLCHSCHWLKNSSAVPTPPPLPSLQLPLASLLWTFSLINPLCLPATLSLLCLLYSLPVRAITKWPINSLPTTCQLQKLVMCPYMLETATSLQKYYDHSLMYMYFISSWTQRILSVIHFTVESWEFDFYVMAT